MSDLRIFPDPILRKKSRAVARFDDSKVRMVIERLVGTMESQPHGIGIAAPQIGVDLRIAVVDVRRRDPQASRWIVINPEIIKQEEEVISREGCMSLPDYRADIKRYRRVRAAWQDERGRRIERDFVGIEAICMQHEIDHLNGMLFIDRVSSLKRDMIPRKKGSS